MANPKMCLIEICGSKFVLSLADAQKAFEAMADAQQVRYDWNDKVHRYVEPGESGHTTLRNFSPVELAQLAMEDPTT